MRSFAEAMRGRLWLRGSAAVVARHPAAFLRAVLKGLLRDHVRVDEAALAARVFPDSVAVKPMAGLLA